MTYVSKKKKALDAIKQTSVHNRDDLILIVSLLQNKLDSFKVLCGCVALERFLEEESRLQALNYHMEKGTVRIEADLATRYEGIANGKSNVYAPYPTVYQQTRSVAGSYKLNPNDVERLIEILMDVMTAKISMADFYHDKAFHCTV